MTIIGKIDSEVFLKSYLNGGEEAFIQNFRFFSAKTSSAGPLVAEGGTSPWSMRKCPNKSWRCASYCPPCKGQEVDSLSRSSSSCFHL